MLYIPRTHNVSSPADRQHVISSIPYKDIWGSDPTRPELEAIIAEMDWRDVVTTSSGLSAPSWQHGIQDADYKAFITSFVQDLPIYGPILAHRVESDVSSVLFTDESILSVLRLAVVIGGTKPHTSNELRDLFVRAALMTNQLIHDELDPAVRTGTSEDLLASELRSRTLNLEPLNTLLARTASFFEWAAQSPEARSSANYLPVEDDLKRFTGLSPSEYTAGAYQMLARSALIRQPNDISRGYMFFTLDRWLEGLRQQDVPRKWVAVNNLPIQTAKADWRHEPSLSLAAAGKLWIKPVVWDGDQYFVPTFKLVANAMGDGMYFKLLDNYGHADKEKFTRFYGEFFEDYIVDLLQKGYAGRGDAQLYPAFKYVRNGNKVDSSDLIVIEGNNVIFFEVVAKRLNLVSSVLRLSQSSIEYDIQRGILEKAEQLHDNIEDFRANTLLPNAPRSQNQKLIPVIVSPHDWPRIWVLDHVWPAAQAATGVLTSVGPLELLDADEVELLEPMLRNGLTLSALLDRKNIPTPNNAATRRQSLHDYIIIMERGILPADTPTRIRGQRIAADIIQMAHSWA